MIKRHIFSHHYQVSKVKLNNFRKSTRSMELQSMTAILGDLLLTSQCVSVNSCLPKTIEKLSTIANKAFKITLTTHHNLVLLSVYNKSKNSQLNHKLEVKKDLGTKVLIFYQCKRNLEVSWAKSLSILRWSNTNTSTDSKV